MTFGESQLGIGGIRLEAHSQNAVFKAAMRWKMVRPGGFEPTTLGSEDLARA